VASEEENWERRGKRGAREAAAAVLKGVDGVEQRRRAGLGWRHAARRWGRGVGGGGQHSGRAVRSCGNGLRSAGVSGAAWRGVRVKHGRNGATTADRRALATAWGDTGREGADR
jgi:hypothetical protein